MKILNLIEAKYYRRSIRDMYDYVNNNYYVWGEDFVGNDGFQLTIEEAGDKYHVSVDFNDVRVDPKYSVPDIYPDMHIARRRAKEIEKEIKTGDQTH